MTPTEPAKGGGATPASPGGGATGSGGGMPAAPLMPAVGLPKGGGAIRGIGEKFAAKWPSRS
ncbi:MAG: hypothetical protein ACM30G_05070 [Micromonosporaceae bacterium]